MDKDKETKQVEEWIWCLVGNIVDKHEYGQEHIIKYGNKQFRPNAKVYINLVFGGMGHERIPVIGMPRHSSKYIEIVIATKYVKNFRVKKVFKPTVLKKMRQSDWEWWDNSDESYNRIMTFIESMDHKTEQMRVIY